MTGVLSQRGLNRATLARQHLLERAPLPARTSRSTVNCVVTVLRVQVSLRATVAHDPWKVGFSFARKARTAFP
jgi:hypothetical protein